MAKQKLIGWIHEPLTAIFGTRAKVAALRILWHVEAAIPYREVVRRSGMAYRSIDLALGELTRTGVVEELAGGRERRVRLRSGHRLGPAIATLLQVESNFFVALRVELRAVAEASRRDGLLGAAIVGAVARRAELLGTPLDVVVLVADVAALPRCRAAFDAASETVAARFGVLVHATLYDLAAARAMWRTRTPAAARSVRDAELLAGSSLTDLLDG
jgi:DNA-binding transcriptional ArsR family regulator